MTLEKRVQAFVAALTNNKPFVEPFDALVAESKRSSPVERDAAIRQLLAWENDHAELLGYTCIASGALVEDGASTLVGLDTILDHLPMFEGVRTIIRAPLGMQRSWGTSLISPIHDALHEHLVLERTLPPVEARSVLSRIAQAAYTLTN